MEVDQGGLVHRAMRPEHPIARRVRPTPASRKAPTEASIVEGGKPTMRGVARTGVKAGSELFAPRFAERRARGSGRGRKHAAPPRTGQRQAIVHALSCVGRAVQELPRCRRVNGLTAVHLQDDVPVGEEDAAVALAERATEGAGVFTEIVRRRVVKCQNRGAESGVVPCAQRGDQRRCKVERRARQDDAADMAACSPRRSDLGNCLSKGLLATPTAEGPARQVQHDLQPRAFRGRDDSPHCPEDVARPLHWHG
mmetsp:Transcript_47772/g.133177  ORF Transcript_47772/g.133177 Transcript_47772/m.133177 type:complete len:253 (-) Transcript_47772:222-980(-)